MPNSCRKIYFLFLTDLHRIEFLCVICFHGLGMLDKAVKIFEKANKTQVLRRVYCAVNGKPESDPELTQFFNFKCW